jgi:sugar lactone lactonase YvrE
MPVFRFARMVWALACVLVFPWVGQAAVLIVQEGTDPNGFFIESTPVNTGDTYTTRTAPLTIDAYRFVYWRVNGVRQADYLGRSINPVKFTVNSNSSAVAVYTLSTGDSDADTILDFFELEFFGDLSKTALSDSDGDGLALFLEYLADTSPLLVDAFVEGGISGRSTANFDLSLNPAYYRATAQSDPFGLIPVVSSFQTGTASWTLPSPPESIDGLRFSGWYLDGVRADKPTTVQPAVVSLSSEKTFSAKYVLESADSDSDELADWYEWFFFSGLDFTAGSDPDGDGLSIAFEKLIGFASYLTDDFSEGGISGRTTAVFQVNLAGYFSFTVASDPPGFVEESYTLNAPGSVAQTAELFGTNINGYRFVGWELDGVRVVDLASAAAGRAVVSMSSDRKAVARFVLDSVDSDNDSMADWWEHFYFGTLSWNATSDVDSDGAPLNLELLWGTHPNLRDFFSEGGISQRPTELTDVIFDWMPDITEHPSSIDAPTGSTVTLRVVASWSRPLSYQWRKNGVDIPGATATELVVPNVKFADSAKYDVAVFNAGVRVLSAPAILSVDGQTNGPFIITKPVDSRNLVLSGSVTLSVIGALGGGTWGYQWVKDGAEIPLATAGSLTIPSMQPWNAGDYTVRVRKTVNTSVAEAIADSATLAIKDLDVSPWQGILAYYPLDGDAKDSSSYLIHGTLKAGSTFGPDQSSTLPASASLKVSGAGATLPDSPLLANTRSVSIWAKMDAISAGRIVLRGDTRARLDPFELSVNATGQPTFGSTVQGGTMVTAAAPLRVGNWTHLAGVYDQIARTVALYVNGSRVSDATAVSVFTGTLDAKLDPGWGIGNHSGVTQKVVNTPFDGSIDNARFYGRPLLASEIAKIYEEEAAFVLPSITAQPLAGVANEGDSYSFSVTAVGVGLSYQWYQDGSPVIGGNRAQLDLLALTQDRGGVYLVKVTNKAGTVASAEARLTVVTPAPVIVSQTSDVSVLWGGSLSFSVTAAGKGTLAYQWSRDGTLLSGATLKTLNLGPARLMDAGSYRVVVSNAFGSVSSVPAKLTVTFPVPKNVFVSPTGNDSTGSGVRTLPYASIQRALDMAAPGDTVTVLAGTYKGSGNQDLNFRGKNVRLIAADGPQKTLVDCGQKKILTLEDGEGPAALIQGFTFTNAFVSDPYDWGGAALVKLKNSSVVIENCVFRDNAAEGTFWTGTTAAALIMASGGDATVRNCLIYKNRLKSGDNATYSAVFGGHFEVIENCSIADNVLDAYMINWWFYINKSLIRVFNTDATTRVLNCISWKNTVSVVGDRREIYPRTEPPTIPIATYSLLDPLQSGTGNISVDPRFRASASGDYSLAQGSPAIDAGDPASSRDANGTRADMGYRVVGVEGVPQAPVIVTQPLGGGVYFGENFTFRVTATGAVPLTYQWRRNGVPVLAGSTFLSVTTVAGSVGSSGDQDGEGTSALFGGMQRMAVDADGNLYMPDAYSNTIRKMSAAGVVSTVAGLSGFSGSADGMGSAARFNGPTGVAVDKNGNLFVADNSNHTIRKITAGGSVTTIAGSAGLSGSVNGTGALARFNRPAGLAVDAAGNIFVADELNHAIRRITASGVVTTFAGSMGAVGAVDGNGSAARFRFPSDIGLDKAGNLYVADSRNHAVRRVGANGAVSTLAGSLGVSGSTDGTGRAARFNRPSGISVDGNGIVYVADLDNEAVRRITAAGTVNTLAGKAGESGSADGEARLARFSSPVDVAVDGSGDVYVSDGDNYTIRRIAMDVTRTGTAPAYAIYNAQPGDAGDYDVVVTNPVGATVSIKATLNVWDRKPVIVRQPLGGTVLLGGSYTLSVAATGVPELQYQWRKNGVSVADAAGAEVAFTSLRIEDSGEYDVVVTNDVGLATSAKAKLNVVYPVPVITTQPVGNGTLTSGGSVSLSAVASGGGTLSYQWFKDGLPLPNATGSSLALGEMRPWLIGDYTLKVSNQTGAAVSNPASLGMAGENSAIWKNLEAYYRMTGDAKDTSPFQIHGTVKNGATFGADRQLAASGASRKVVSNGHELIAIPGYPIAFSKFETTVGQWKEFVAATGWNKSDAWKNPRGYEVSFTQTDSEPVVNVSWEDANDYCAWLSTKTGAKCRLPSRSEWVSAAGTSKYPWGDTWPPKKEEGNYNMDASGEADFPLGGIDGFRATAPVGSFKPNALGLHDMAGNVFEWISDTSVKGNNDLRDCLGSSWLNSGEQELQTRFQGNGTPQPWRENGDVGFRVVVETLPVVNRYAVIPGVFGSFAAAEEDAETRGGHLATITSAGEYAEVKRQLGGSLTGGVFLGAYKDSANVAANAGWKWVTGEAFDYANWRGGEPNNYDGQERFVEIYADWTWNDLAEKWFKGDGPAGYLIEFEGAGNGDPLGSLSSGTAGIAVPDSSLLYKARTFSLWAKKDASASGQLLFHGDTRSGFDPLGISIDQDGYVALGSNMPGGFVVRSVAPIETGRWVHIVGSVDEVSLQATLYLDGRVNAAAQAATSIEFPLDLNQDAGWGIGNHSGVTQTIYNLPFKGSIDDVRFYNRVLTATEVAQLYQYEAPSHLPIITLQPLTGTGELAGRYSFSVAAVGDDLTYQWRRNGVNIVGATLPLLALEPLRSSDAGSYDVVVSNAFASTTSSAAILTLSGILTPPNPNPGGSPADYVIYVSKTGSDASGIGTLGNPFLTIGRAVALAPSGARILVGAGTYVERLEFGGKTLRIHSLAGPMATTIRGAQGRSVVIIDGADSELRGFRISGGTGEVYQNSGGAERFGGGVICSVNASIADCVVDGNGRWGTGVDAASGSYGGGIAVMGGRVGVANCLIVNNAVSRGGGALYVQNGAMEMDRCTVHGNSSTANSAGVAAALNGKVSVRNSIVFGNGTVQLGTAASPSEGAAFAVEYSDVSGNLNGGGASWSLGAGNIAADPLFADATKLNFSLKTGSPAINSGDPGAPLDPDGTRADMGWRADRYNVETVLYVDKNGSDATGNGSQGRPYSTLTKAVAVAPRGARILVGAGVYAERLDYGGKTLRIHSLYGADFTTIRGARGNPVVTIDSGAAYSELRGFRIVGGHGSNVDGKRLGGGVFAAATAYISDCVITGNGLGRNQTEACLYGGALYASGGAVTVVNCLIYDNLAWLNGGAVYVENGSVELDRSTIHGNNTAAFEGARGGVVAGIGGKALVRNSILWGNRGGQLAAELAPGNVDTELFVEYSDVEGELAQTGAEVFRKGFGNVSGDPLFADVDQGNFALLPGSPAKDAAAPGLPQDEDGTAADMGWRAGRYANGVELYVSKDGSDTTGTGSVAAPFLTIGKAVSVAPAGAWILVGSGTYAERVDYADKTLGIRSLNGPADTTIQGVSGNTVVSIGTGASNSRLQGFRITGGTGKPFPSSYGFDYYGGGVYCVTTAFLSDCIIEGNGKGTPRQNSATFGGAIYSGGGKLSVSNCLIHGNYAWASGGAVLTESGTIEFDRCTVQGNDATTFLGRQGGLSVAHSGKMVVRNSIVYGNSGSQLGAFGAPYNADTSIQVEYSDIQGVIDGGGTPSLLRGAGNIGTDPLFVNVTGRNFGLKPGSPAIDAADPLAAKDPDGTRADMGWRVDRFYKGSVLRKPPTLKITSAPGNGTKVLVPFDNNVVLVGGVLTHDSGMDGVVFSWSVGAKKFQTNIDVNEVDPVEVGGLTQRAWEWVAEIPVEEFGRCDYSVVAVDQSNFKSPAISGNFTLARGARVLVNVPEGKSGTLSVSPGIPADTMVEVGTTLRIVATPQPGYLFRLLEVNVDGLPEDDITRNNVSLVVSADTSITAQFIPNPYPAMAGQWTGTIMDGWTSGLVLLNMTPTGAYSIRIVSGRNSLSRNGVLDVSGNSLISIPASFWPYSETKNSQETANSTARKPVSARVSLQSGALKFEWGNGDPSLEAFGSADLSKAADAALVASLTARRYNSAVWRDLGATLIDQDGSTTRFWDKGAGFASIDFSTSGIALMSGMTRVADKTVRYTFSGSVTPVRPILGVIADAGGYLYGPPDGVCMKPYAVTNASDIVLDGVLEFDRAEVSGPLTTRYVRTGTPDFRASVGASASIRWDSIGSPYDLEFAVSGYPYVAPKVGQVPLPFLIPGRPSFGVTIGTNRIGTLSLAGVRPFFRSGATGPSENWTMLSASMSVTTTNGVFTGNALMQGTLTGGTGSASRMTRSFNGLLLQGGSQAAAGISGDGWPVSFE